MLTIDQQTLIASLNANTHQALEDAAGLCVSQSGYEITIEHLLVKALEQPATDLYYLLSHYRIDRSELSTLLNRQFDRQRTSTASYPVFSPLLLEWIQDTWTLSSLEYKQQKIRTGCLLLTALKNPGRYLSLEVHQFLNSINTETLSRELLSIIEASCETELSRNDAQGKATGKTTEPMGDTPLDKFGINFTLQAKEGKIDPIFCRDKELDQMVDILSRRRKNNPIAVGEAGVGKSAIVEGLALKIINNEVPETLQGVELWGLDMGALQAGASVKGEFEKRLKGVIEQVKVAEPPVVLFIDEAHTLIGAGNQAGGSDAANLLKPALARGELRTIAATTWSEYKKYFEKDPALSRRFQLIKLDEPSIDQATIIIRGLVSIYEKAHSVYITDEAVKAASSLSARYISGRQLPDKAIDVLDTASARVSTSLTSPPRELNLIKQKLRQFNAQHEYLQRDAIFTENKENGSTFDELEQEILTLKDQQESLESQWESEKSAITSYLEKRHELMEKSKENIDDISEEERQELAQLKSQLDEIQGENALINYQVGAEEIATVIADWTGIPVNRMSRDEVARITQLDQRVMQLIKGQDQAIDRMHQRLMTARADLRREGLPQGAFLLVGPSGVGKTETALQIAEHLFGSQQFVTTINMSEYQEKHTLSRLIGSPPGYVGYGEGGILTEAIRQRPYSVVLLDEVEKANPEIMNLFYQVFDKGEMNDGEGRTIDCKNNVFIMTSNLGTDEIMDFAEQGNSDIDELEETLLPLLSQWFKPALLARMEVIPYLPLNDDVLALIVESKLQHLIDRLKTKHQINLACSQMVKTHIQHLCNRSDNGARIIDSLLEGQLLPPISLQILESLGESDPIQTINIDVEEHEFVYYYQSQSGNLLSSQTTHKEDKEEEEEQEAVA